MGLRIYVLKNPLGDCTNGGISSCVDSLTVVNIDGPFEPADDAPPVLLVEHHRGCLSLVPAERSQGGTAWRKVQGKHFMMGGNYGATSDGRFSGKCETLLGHRFYGAVAIHDRVE
jgi:hypothetical protein